MSSVFLFVLRLHISLLGNIKRGRPRSLGHVLRRQVDVLCQTLMHRYLVSLSLSRRFHPELIVSTYVVEILWEKKLKHRSTEMTLRTLCLSLAVITFCLVYQTQSVDRGNFKTCSQSGFCKQVTFLLLQVALRVLIDWIDTFVLNRRQRNYKPSTSPYQVQFETIKIDNGHLNADVLNTQNSVVFTLDLYLLKDNRYRFRFNEKSPLKTRYEVEDIIIDPLEQEKWVSEYFCEWTGLTKPNISVFMWSSLSKVHDCQT